VRALELPYVEERLAMLILLPDRLDGLEQLEDSLTLDEIDRIVASLSSHRVTVSMPKFRTELGEPLVLGSTLQGMGMSAAFDPARADFMGMASPLDLADKVFIDDVLHKAFVEVDEEGTEAWAASGEMFSLGVEPSLKTARFRADHPFLFLIRDVESGLVLFLGRVADPSER
jgi:serpin B